MSTSLYIRPYPVFAWPVTFSAATVTVNVVTAGPTNNSEVLTFPAGDWLGWSNGGDSIADKLAAALLTHTLITAVAVTLLDSDDGAFARPTYRIDCTAATGIAITITAATTGVATACGLATLPVSLVATGGVFRLENTRNLDGLFSGCTDASDMTPSVQIAARQQFAALTYGARSTVRPGANLKRSQAFTLYRVAGRYISTEWASDPAFAAQAGESTSDLNNTLEGLALAATSGEDITVCLSSAEQNVCAMDWGGGEFDLSSLWSDASQGGRRCNVTLLMRETA